MRLPTPFTLACTGRRFTFQRLRETLWAWLMVFPNSGFLPQISQTCAMTAPGRIRNPGAKYRFYRSWGGFGNWGSGLRTWLGQIIHAPVALCAHRGKMITVKPQKSAPDQGIGLYTNEQTKYTTPFQYFAQIVVGAVVIWLGAMLAYAKYQSPFRISPGLIAAIALIAVGMFQAHAGAIFWYRRLRKRNLSH